MVGELGRYSNGPASLACSPPCRACLEPFRVRERRHRFQLQPKG